MPKNAVIHIQKIAPGPPRKIAVATPAIFPVPTVAERAVISDSKGVISPSTPLSPFPNSSRKAKFIFLTEKNFKPIVKNTPTPRRSTSVNGPHTMLLISPKITFIIIYKEYRIHYFDFHSRFLIH